MGYTFVGDTSLYELTLPEVRVLAEGKRAKQKKKAQESGQTTGTGVHERAPGEDRESDKQFVEHLASDS